MTSGQDKIGNAGLRHICSHGAESPCAGDAPTQRGGYIASPASLDQTCAAPLLVEPIGVRGNVSHKM